MKTRKLLRVIRPIPLDTQKGSIALILLSFLTYARWRNSNGSGIILDAFLLGVVVWNMIFWKDLQRKSTITLSKEGLRFGGRVYPWEELRGASLRPRFSLWSLLSGAQDVSVEYVSSRTGRGASSRLLINMAAFELEPEKVARLINERIPHRRQTAHGERAGQDDFFEEIPGTSFLTLGNAVLVVLALAILVGVVGQQR